MITFTQFSLLLCLLLPLYSTTDAFSPSSIPSRTAFPETNTMGFVTSQEAANDFEEDGIVQEEPEDDYIVTAGELEGGDDEEDVGVEADGSIPVWAASQERMTALREKYRRHDKDTGSPEYQVAGMTERITYLTQHLQQHPKDFSTRRGLVALVNKRRRLLNYLFKEDVERYKVLVSSIGVRHKPPGRVESRTEKYGRFPKQKAIKKHLVK